MSLSPEGGKASRNYEKCQQCRRDHKMCKPQSRSALEKCDRCTRLGRECGPPVKARTRGRPKTSVDTDGERNKLVQFPAIHDCPFPHGLSTGLLGRMVDLRLGSYGLAVNATAQRLFHRCRSDLQSCLVSRAHYFVNAVIKRCEVLRDRLDRLISQLHEHQLFGHQGLWSQREDSHKLLNEDILSSVGEDSGNFKVLVCSANILDQPTHAASRNQKGSLNGFNGLPPDYYRSTEIALRQLMESISAKSIDEKSSSHCTDSATLTGIHSAFPASHIAYLNMDREAALKLWEMSSATAPLEIDILGRTFPHVVAEAGDSELLGRMGVPFLKNVGLDARGLSLLDLAKIRDNATSIEMIAGNNIVSVPFTQSIPTASYLCHSQDIEQQFPPHLELMHQRGVCDSTTLRDSENMAGESGYIDLQTQPKTIAHQNSVLWDENFELGTYNFNFTESYLYSSGDSPQYSSWDDLTVELSTSPPPESIMGSSLENSNILNPLSPLYYPDFDTSISQYGDFTLPC